MEIIDNGQDKLKQEAHFLSSIVNSEEPAFCLVQGNNRIVTASRAFLSLHELEAYSKTLTLAEVFASSPSSLIAVESLLDRARQVPDPCCDESFLLNIPGQPQPFQLHACQAREQNTLALAYSPFRIEADSPELVNAHLRAIQRLSITLRSIGEGVITTDELGRIELFNPEAENITGYSAQAVRGKPLESVIRFYRERDENPLTNPIREVIDSALPIGEDRDILLQTSGGMRKVAFDLAPILDNDQKLLGTVLVIEDISQKTRIEQELQKIQKMDSLAMLSAGIAHDFNNFLTTIMGNLSLARSSLEPEHPLCKLLKNAERGTQHAKLLTDRLYSFSRSASPLKKHCALKDLLEDTAAFIFTGSRTRWESTISEKLWLCEVDEGQLSQVLNNLFINASQAMPEGGIVTIGARNRKMLWDPSLSLQNGPYVEIRISDEGVGIEPQNMEKLFEPYFTTKPKGNGLGLATCYSIIKSHDGHILVDSDLGKGTTFTLYIPADPAAKLIKSEQATQIARGTGRILVMDDEDLVQDIAGQMLEHLGYQVDFARHGEGALELYREAMECGEPFDLVILDLSVNHGSGGNEALRLLQGYHPSVRALLSSGYAHREEVRLFQNHGYQGTIIKPYNIEQLSWAVQHALGTGV